MKPRILLSCLLVLILLLSACHPTHFMVGQEIKPKQMVSERNKFLFLGLIHVGTAPDPKAMSNNATDYQISVQLTFTDILLNAVTLGIYSPLTVKVAY